MVWWLGSLVSTLAFSGELTGTVVDTAGQPVADVYVVAFDRRMDYTVTTTDEQGEYAITGLNPGPHRLRVIPTLEQNLAEQWTPGTLEVCAAHRYPLPSSDSVDTVSALVDPESPCPTLG